MWETSLSFKKSFVSNTESKGGQPYNNITAMKRGIYENHDLNYPPSYIPKMENNELYSSQNTDDRIGEWLANEEASLDKIPMNYYEQQENNLFHHNQVHISY
jgi:hypothetical protein